MQVSIWKIIRKSELENTPSTSGMYDDTTDQIRNQDFVCMATLEHECDETIGRLRAALIDLYDSVDADPSSPQDVARRFKLNKTLTWNIARLIQSSDGFGAVPHMPGIASIEKIIKATESEGATQPTIDRVRAAAKDFERVIEVHVGDRATLDLIIDGLGPNGGIGLEQSRKRAFTGNSGIYGIQAKTNLMSCFLAPNADDPDQLDMAMVRGHLGLRRLRPSVSAPIFRMRQWSQAGQAVGTQQWEPIEPGQADRALRSFNKGDVPEIEAVEAESGTDYVIKPGPIGNRGAFDCFFGDMIRAGASRFRTEADTTGEFGATIAVPAEHLVFDLIFHKDLAFCAAAETRVYAYSFLRGNSEGEWDDSTLLPINQPASLISGSPPAVATPLVPRYSELIQMVTARMGVDAGEFRGLRFELKFPPLGSTAVIRFGLQEPS